LFNRRFGVPLGFERMTPAVASVLIQLEIVADETSPKVDCRARRRARWHAAPGPAPRRTAAQVTQR
jgi:hypothetical protein